jgi:hypothetical protein
MVQAGGSPWRTKGALRENVTDVVKAAEQATVLVLVY